MVLSCKTTAKCREDGSGNAAGGGGGGAGSGFWLLVLLLDDKASKHSLLKKAQSTIWVCLFILAFTLVLFTLCSLDSVSRPHHHHAPPPTALYKKWRAVKPPAKPRRPRFDRSLALHGLGTVFRRGTFAMSDLVVAHFREDTNEEMLRFFCRGLFRSGVLSRADIVFILPSSSSSSALARIIHEEDGYFVRLMDSHNNTERSPTKGISRFDSRLFIGSHDKKKPPIWGANVNRNFSNSSDGRTSMTLGSIVGFDVSELNPENSLSGFLDDVPIQLRRWVCYQLLLGRLRHQFKHVALVDVERVMVVGDLMAGIWRKNGGARGGSDGLKLFVEENSPHKCRGAEHPPKPESLYKKDQLDKEKRLVNSGIILGPMVETRRFINEMAIEIVRVAVRRKIRRPFHDGELLTYLAVTGQSSGKAITLENARSYYYHHSIFNPSPASSHRSFILYGHDNCSGMGFKSLVGLLHNEICSSPIDSTVYRDCLYAYTQHS
ncbi:uncharacterized protein LOC116260061 [Nymphaea colorata]|uniref:uncharacterized protein LOC116260061 n=1 Tax=Nymphaea colorata TaxID=210225 RepID=UPI00129D5CA4|nr:uncharacterized protein LOC116260061 [Nymphaea colorata]